MDEDGLINVCVLLECRLCSGSDSVSDIPERDGVGVEEVMRNR